MDSNLSRYERPTSNYPSNQRDDEAGRPASHEAKQLRAEVDAARSVAEQAERHRDELLSRVAHELRGPLNSISGWVQLLQSGRLDEERQQRALEAIARGIRAQTALIDEMQNVSRALRNRLQLTPAAIDLSAPLQRAVESIRPQATQKSIVISATVDHGIRVHGDSEYLMQLFARLLDNAVRCTPERGSIDVRLCARKNEAWACIEDTGVGIAPDVLPNIFEPFVGTTDARTRNHRGLGAGLALARRIAELHDGRIDAYSDGPDRGARFIVSIPRIRARDNAASSVRSLQATVPEPLHDDHLVTARST